MGSLFKVSAVFILAGLTPLVCEGQEKFTEREVEIASVLGVPIANSEAWQRGDVLIRLTESFDNVKLKAGQGPTGAVFSNKEMTRIVFDFEKGKHLQCSLGNLDGTYFPDNAGPPKEIDRSGIAAKITDFKKKHCWQYDNGSFFNGKSISRNGVKDIHDFLFQQRMTNIRAIWTSPHHGKFFTDAPLQSRLAIWEVLRVAKNLEKYHYDGDENLVLEYVWPLKNQAKNVWTVWIDPDSQMPTKIREEIHPKDGRKGLVGVATIEWELMNDVYLPRSIGIKQGKTMMLEGIGKTAGLIKQNVEFHWFSINKDLPEDSFSPDRIKNPNAIIQLLDPVATGAEALIEKTVSATEGATVDSKGRDKQDKD